MNWIKSNPFVAALAGATLVVCATLYLFASHGSSRYEAAQEEFEQAYQQVNRAEALKPYPIDENRDGKGKALAEYVAEITELRSKFDPYRPEELKNISVQAFTEQLKAAAEKTGSALTSAGCDLPEGYFLGFEQYRGQLANSNATGVLKYQLDAIEQAMGELAKARPSELLRVYREPVPEETGGTYSPAPKDAVRLFGFEVAFKGSEASVREFLSSIGKAGENYFIVRCVAIQNERDTPPRSSDARFDSAANSEPAEAVSENPFGGAFILPGGEESFEEEQPATQLEEQLIDGEANPSPEADSSRILAQVLGNEELIVLVRFDLTMFLPSVELPKP